MSCSVIRSKRHHHFFSVINSTSLSTQIVQLFSISSFPVPEAQNMWPRGRWIATRPFQGIVKIKTLMVLLMKLAMILVNVIFYLCMKVVTSGRFAWFSESILSPKWPAHAVTKAWIGKKFVHISLNKKKNWDSACSVSSVDEDMRITVKINNAFFLFAKASLSCPVIFEHSCTIQNAIQRHETKK